MVKRPCDEADVISRRFEDIFGKFAEARGRAVSERPEPVPLRMKGIVMRRFVIWTLLLCVLDIGSSAALGDTTEELVTKGQSALQESRYDAAIEAFNKALQADSKCFAAYFMSGVAYGAMGDNAKAIRDLSKAIELRPDDADPYIARAAAYQLIDPDRAMSDIRQAIRLAPNDAVAHVGQSAFYLEKRDYEAAIAAASEAIRLDRKNAEAYRYRCRAYCAKGDYPPCSPTQRERSNLIRETRTRTHAGPRPTSGLASLPTRFKTALA